MPFLTEAFLACALQKLLPCPSVTLIRGLIRTDTATGEVQRGQKEPHRVLIDLEKAMTEYREKNKEQGSFREIHQPGKGYNVPLE